MYVRTCSASKEIEIVRSYRLPSGFDYFLDQ